MKSLVSVVITTKNEEDYLKSLLKSIKKQTYRKIEILVIDNNSADKTLSIARQFTKNVFTKGPERSAQRNFGAKKARGEYVLFLDADMELNPKVISECVQLVQSEKIEGIIISEESFGVGFWSKVKSFERSFYTGDDTIEAARFYGREVFLKMGGFDESITGPEDWDFSQRVRKKFGLARIKSNIRHNEGQLTLAELFKKKYY